MPGLGPRKSRSCLRREKLGLDLIRWSWTTITGNTVRGHSYRMDRARLLTVYSSDDIMSSIMPEDQQDDLPSAFSVTGHIGRMAIPDLDSPD
jgi:hypothetical protein